MKDDHIELDGKMYISSTKAAEDMGYSKDYIGQLARAGKIDAKLIGRSWYVADTSIKEHKGSVNYTLTKPKKKRAVHTSRETEISSNGIDISEKEVISRDGKNTDVVIPPSVPELEVLLQKKEKEPPLHVTPQKTLAHEVLSALGTDSQKGDRAAVLTVPIRTEPRRSSYRDPLKHADISFEPGEPIFFEDDRPARPPVRSVARFGGVPIIHDRSNPPVPIVPVHERSRTIADIQPSTDKKRARQYPSRPSSVPVPMDGIRSDTSIQSKQGRRYQGQYAKVPGRSTAAIQEDITSYGVRTADVHPPQRSRRSGGLLVPIVSFIFLIGFLWLLWVLFGS
jgi:hypothetical protein